MFCCPALANEPASCSQSIVLLEGNDATGYICCGHPLNLCKAAVSEFANVSCHILTGSSITLMFSEHQENISFKWNALCINVFCLQFDFFPFFPFKCPHYPVSKWSIYVLNIATYTCRKLKRKMSHILQAEVTVWCKVLPCTSKSHIKWLYLCGRKGFKWSGLFRYFQKHWLMEEVIHQLVFQTSHIHNKEKGRRYRGEKGNPLFFFFFFFLFF